MKWFYYTLIGAGAIIICQCIYPDSWLRLLIYRIRNPQIGLLRGDTYGLIGDILKREKERKQEIALKNWYEDNFAKNINTNNKIFQPYWIKLRRRREYLSVVRGKK